MSLRQFLRPSGLRRRFLLALLLVGVLPLVALGGTISITTRNTLLQQRHQHLTSLAGVLGAQIQVFLQEHIEEIEAVATLSDVASLEPQRVQPQLQAMNRTLGEFEPLAVIDPQGMVVARSDGGPLAWVGDLWLFQQVTRQGTAAWDILSAKVTERPALVIMVPIRDEQGEVIGIVSGSLDLRTFVHMLEQTTAGTAGRAYIVDHAGRVVAHPDPTYVAERQDMSAAPLVQAARAGQYPVARFMEEGEAWLGVYGAIPDWGWIVVVQHPEAEILIAATRAQRFSLLAVLIAGMGAVLVSVLLATRLSSPILQLAAAAQKLAVGDYDAHLPSPPSGDVGILVVAFDNMRHQLKAFYEDLEHQVERRTQAVQQELAERKRAEEALRKAHDELEKRVAERTADVVKANEELRLEIVERKRAEEELRLLLRLTQAIDETSDLHSALEVVLDNVFEVTGWDYGEIWIPSDDGSALESAPAWRSKAPERLAGFRQVTEEFTFQPNIGLPGRVWSSKQPEWLPDVSATPDAIFLRAGIAAETGLKAGFGIPIIAGEDMLAVLAFFLFESREEDRHLIELVSAVAAQLGWAMQRKQTQAALIEAEKMAIAGRLAASLAHEINNPLQTVIGCLGLAEEMLAERGDASRYLQVAHEELRRTANIVARLRDLYRPSKPEDKEPTDVNALLDQVLDLSRKQCESQGIEVLRTMADVPVLPLAADQIKQVLLNLLLNAFEAMPQGGRLQVSTTYTSQPAGVRIAFTDSGGGIAPDVLPHVFEPFYSTRPEGLGLGLFISRNIVKQHGGQIEVDSRVGEGATFTVWLPGAPSAPQDWGE